MGQGKEYQEGVSVYDKQPFCDNQNTVSTSAKTVLFDTSSLPSIPALPLLLMAKTMALKKTQSYESILFLNQAAQEELLWWRDHLAAWNGRSLLRKKDDLLIETDASNLGWGACCNRVRTGGIWSDQERLQHINCLELRRDQTCGQVLRRKKACNQLIENPKAEQNVRKRSRNQG